MTTSIFFLNIYYLLKQFFLNKPVLKTENLNYRFFKATAFLEIVLLVLLKSKISVALKNLENKFSVFKTGLFLKIV